MNSRPESPAAPPAYPRLAFVDLETTGATPADDRITEIGIVEVGADGVQEWSTLVDPQRPISEFIERLTGISDAMVADAPVFATVADEVRSRLDGRLFIAHNARFDYGFLASEFKRLGVDFRATVLCTVKLSRKLEPQHARHNLDALVARHGLVVDGRHRALADARLIHQLWQKLHARFPAETIRGVIDELTARPSLPPEIDITEVKALPEGHGVYVFRDEAGRVLCVRRSPRVRSSVLALFAAGKPGPRELELSRAVRRIEGFASPGDFGAALLEANLARKLEPVYRRGPGSGVGGGTESFTWRLADAGGGRWQVSLVSADEIDSSAESGCYGLYPSRREATRSLQRIAREHRLCLSCLGLEPEAPGHPCSARAKGLCRGACVGDESPSMHAARTMAALARLQLKRWPFAGAAVLREGDTLHAFAHWRYLGSANDEQAFRELFERPRPGFDPAIYGLLVKALGRLAPAPFSS